MIAGVACVLSTSGMYLYSNYHRGIIWHSVTKSSCPTTALDPTTDYVKRTQIRYNPLSKKLILNDGYRREWPLQYSGKRRLGWMSMATKNGLSGLLHTFENYRLPSRQKKVRVLYYYSDSLVRHFTRYSRYLDRPKRRTYTILPYTYPLLKIIRDPKPANTVWRTR